MEVFEDFQMLLECSVNFFDFWKALKVSRLFHKFSRSFLKALERVSMSILGAQNAVVTPECLWNPYFTSSLSKH